MYFLGGSRVFMDLKALLCLCSGDDESPQHRSVLRAINTLNSPQKYICLLGGFSPIHLMHWRRAEGLMWGTRGPYLPAAAMVGYGCVGWCWQLEANVRSTYCRNSKTFLWKYFFYSYVDPIHSWHLTWQLNKEDLDLCTWAFRLCLCPGEGQKFPSFPSHCLNYSKWASSCFKWAQLHPWNCLCNLKILLRYL